MKKYFALFAMLFVALPVFASETPAEFDSHFKSFAAFAAIIPFITEAFKKLIKPPEGLWTQVLSWGVGIASAMFAFLVNIGIFETLLWYEALGVGVAGSLVANGIFDTGIVTWILKKLGLIKK